jgi:hypothetical protein
VARAHVTEDYVKVGTRRRARAGGAVRAAVGEVEHLGLAWIIVVGVAVVVVESHGATGAGGAGGGEGRPGGW